MRDLCDCSILLIKDAAVSPTSAAQPCQATGASSIETSADGATHQFGDEPCVCMTAAARKPRKVVREELFAWRLAIRRQLEHLDRRILATELPNGLAQKTQMPTLREHIVASQTMRRRASALVARKDLYRPASSLS